MKFGINSFIFMTFFAFVAWLVVAAVFFGISWIYEGKGGFMRTLEFVGYGFIPSILGGLISAVLVYNFVSTIHIPVFIFLVLSVGNIILKGFSKEIKYPVFRLLAFFFVMHIFIFMRDLAFGCYSIRPRFIVLGAALIMYAVLSKLIGWLTKLFKTKVVHF